MKTINVKEALLTLRFYKANEGYEFKGKQYIIYSEGVGPDGWEYGPSILASLYHDILKAFRATKVKEFTVTRIDHETLVIEYVADGINKGQMILNYKES